MGKQYTVLEINDQALRIVVGKQYRTHALIQHVYTTTLPQNARSEHELFDPSVLGPFLKDLFTKLALRNKRVIVSVVKHNLLSRVHQFPKTSLKDLESMVNIYISDTFPVEVDEYILDYGVLRSDAKNHLVRINVLKKASVRSLYDSLLSAGLQPLAFTPQSWALDRSLGLAEKLNHIPHDVNGTYGLFHYQGNVVCLSLFQDGHLVFSRNIRANISVDTTDFLDNLSETYTQQFRALAQRKFKFKEPERFYLAGSIEDPLKTREMLEERLGKPVDVIRTLSTVRYARPQPANILQDANAAGCLMTVPANLKKKHRYFDFFHNFKLKDVKRSNRRALIGGAIVIAILFGSYYALSYQERLALVKHKLDWQEQELRLLQLEEESSGSAQAVLSLEATEAYHEQLMRTADFIAKQPRVSSDQMLSVVEIMPPDVVLDSLSVNPENIFLSCRAKSRKSISEYEYLLKETSFIEEVFISFVTGETSEDAPDTTTYTFTVDCTIGQGGSSDES